MDEIDEVESIPVNLPWEPGTDECLNPKSNVIYLVDEPQIDEETEVENITNY